MIIYKVVNIINKKCYIGQALDFLKRKRCHISYSKKEKPTSYFHRALKKYGFDNFNWKILCECNSKEELDEMEFHYIKQYNSINNGYNLTFGGEGTYGYKLYGKKNGMFGKKHSKETKMKISNTLKGNIPWNKGENHTIETKEKISKSLKGKIPWNKGKHHTEETKKKISDTKKGKIPIRRKNEHRR